MHTTGMARFRDEEYNLKISHCYDFIIQLKFFVLCFFFEWKKSIETHWWRNAGYSANIWAAILLKTFWFVLWLESLKVDTLDWKFILEQSLPKL